MARQLMPSLRHKITIYMERGLQSAFEVNRGLKSAFQNDPPLRKTRRLSEKDKRRVLS
jgi:hypothetical protein